ncbi:MAG TPA: hypothetical protein VF515_17830 [Candidatus Binatia bacterium]
MESIATSHRVIPFTSLTAPNCAVIAERGRIAMSELGRAKVGRVLSSRLSEAVHYLDQVATRGGYGDNPEVLRETLDAIALVVDFFQITGALPEEVPGQITNDLVNALQDRFAGRAGRRLARDFLSQYWFGLVLVRGGISPRVPVPVCGRPAPDFVVPIDTLDVVVEVKRPESLHSAPDAMDKAASQIRANRRPGLIAMDLSDAVLPADVSVAGLDYPVPVPQVYRAPFWEATERLERRACTYSRSDKYARVIGLAMFARLHYWQRPNLSEPKGSTLLVVTSFRTAYEGLVSQQSDKLQRIIISGTRSVEGGAVHRF